MVVIATGFIVLSQLTIGNALCYNTAGGLDKKYYAEY